MKASLSRLALAATALAAIAGPAVSGDWNNGAGGIKDYRGGGALVAAPAPIPEYRSNWYLRGDVGMGFASDPSVSEAGIQYGRFDAPGLSRPNPFGTMPAWFTKDFDTSFNGGVGVGYYWSSMFRTDVTVDLMGANSVTAKGSYSYTPHRFTGVPATYGPDTTNGRQVIGTVVDKTELNSTALLFNAYADLARGGPLTPYIGGGVGLAYTKAERSHRTDEYLCETAVDPLCQSRTERSGYRLVDNSHSVGLAAAAMAGFAYDMTSSTKLDIGYRYLYIAGSKASLAFDDGVKTVLDVGAQHQHQIRAGIRFDIN